MDTYEHIITHLRLISARKQPCDDAFVKQALEHPDPIVRQWAISAASRVKDREFIFEKLQQILNSDVYYDVRIYALFYLTKMHYKISRILVDDFLSQAVTSKQKAIIYEVLRMLQVLIPLEETRSYKELVNMGRQKATLELTSSMPRS